MTAAVSVAVVHEQEAGLLEQRRLRGVGPRRAHARVHGREDHVHEPAADERGVHGAEREAEEPAGLADAAKIAK